MDDRTISPHRSIAGGAWPMQEIRFSLPGQTGNPFHFEQNDIRAVLRLPDGKTLRAAAFFDGDDLWKVRLTPRAAGRYTVTGIERNGSAVTPVGLTPASFTASGKAMAGFIDVDPTRPLRFVADDASAYYPLGHNAAWRGGNLDIPEIFGKMQTVGENWSRVWMCHWSGANLDWPAPPGPPKTLSLDVARYWDRIVSAAEKAGVHFQMVLQHHGQYSSTVNPNWGECPWNRANGGFLARPDDFFTDPEARSRTKAKYRYIVARWGYSPAVLAWELFNEVQFTDAARARRYDVIAAWHAEMAAFLRAHDVHRHLITTSSELSMPHLFDAVDYVQAHAYQSDPITTAQGLHPKDWKKPLFWGEIGPSGDNGRDDEAFLHPVLWASLMSETSGAACFWAWDRVDRKNLYKEFAPVSDFLKRTELGRRDDLTRIDPLMATPGMAGAVSFAPGVGWGKGDPKRLVVGPSGNAPGIEGISQFLQGVAHPELGAFIEFAVDLPASATFAVTVSQSSRGGGTLRIGIDGKTAAEKAFAASGGDARQSVTTDVSVPAGKHVIRLDNPGPDWVVINRIALSPYGPAVRTVARGAKDAVALWFTRSVPGDNPISATITVPDVNNGRWRVLWYDPVAGKTIRTEVVEARGQTLRLNAPPVARELALWAAKA